jgi:ethanolamine-phosphate cytidylyltransferase
VYDNETVNTLKGKNYPILNLQERVLNLLALRDVDEVIIGVPYRVTETMIKNFKISLVVQGVASNKSESEESVGFEVPIRM